MRTLLIDNYDSYTYNLFHLLAEVYGAAPAVLTNDAPEWDGLDLRAFDAIVVSPGPGRPQVGRDVGAVLDVLRHTDLPVLGVCLGHQAIGWLAGAQVVPAPAPRHGYLERVRHVGRDLFAGLRQDFTAVRYHSLCVPEPLPSALEPLAWAADGVLMALRHRERPWWGVQFHPESIATEHGRALLENFRRLGSAVRPVPARRPLGPWPPERARPWWQSEAAGRHGGAAGRHGGAAGRHGGAAGGRASRWSVRFQRLEGEVDPARTFASLFGHQPYAFWLDSSRVEPGLARFSFLGDSGGASGEVLTYRVGARAVEVRRECGPTTLERGSIFEVLEDRLRARRVEPSAALPFDLHGGYVGYFGYELKGECGARNRHRSLTHDAVWMAATRLVVIDHEQHTTWLVALCPPGDVGAAAEAERWLALTGSLLRGLRQPDEAHAPAAHASGAHAGNAPAGNGHASVAHAGDEPDPAPWLVQPRERYLADIARCQAELRAGESYEICLTNAVETPFDGDPFSAYLRLRRVNPAPYAAYLVLGDTHVLCSSPERFLKIGPDGSAESKPIKGTQARHPDPQRDARLRHELESSAKDRAENLMVTDLVRNDLGRVCEVGSVTVPRLMAVETYASVHQLTSTVRGRLRPQVSPVAAARACFPGGSMTGAPKLRTMEIIDRLETRARGIYSGALGFFGLSGSADLGMVIRTAVLRENTMTLGTGGAIVLDSDAAAEVEELLLKARAPLRAVGSPIAATLQATLQENPR